MTTGGRRQRGFGWWSWMAAMAICTLLFGAMAAYGLATGSVPWVDDSLSFHLFARADSPVTYWVALVMDAGFGFSCALSLWGTWRGEDEPWRI